MFSDRLVIVVPAHMHFSKARLDKKVSLLTQLIVLHAGFNFTFTPQFPC